MPPKRIRYNKDGTIDKRCSAYKQGEIFLKQDGSIDKRCSAYKQGQTRRYKQQRKTYKNKKKPAQSNGRYTIKTTWRGPSSRTTYGHEIKILYHITDYKAAQSIKRTRRMIRGSDGMFGGGIYFAETIQDAQYKSLNNGGWLITAKVFTGKALELHYGNAGKYNFRSLSNEGCDSIYAPQGGGNGNAEWVVFNMDQVFIVKVEKI